jgi:hypothetical protein
MRTVGLIGLVLGLTLSGCQRHSYTEEDAQRAIAKKLQQTNAEIEQGVRAAPPVEVETPSAPSAPQRETAAPSGGSAFELPPPNRYDAPLPASRSVPAQQSPPPNVGDVKLDPQTGQYGIQPPGAPDTYTIPLDRQQGQ